ncbi:SRPBCC family protein [Amycolatopsis minnesotensis]|uniref:Activator of Hsp90 ATPase homologue 1/2-like C-terminal domain-containing protein n=1 Tax=Amycolatopsis minnesotensis TaxID=337894 RepID=A0ABP5DYD6_9PSEU
MDRGTFIEHEGRPAVRFQRTYAHPVDRLWAAITRTEDLAHWFPSKVALEGEVGGTVSFSHDPNVDDDHGTVLAYDPPHRLAFTWGGDELHFELAPAAGGCTLTLINVLEARDTAARNAAGWAVCLAELGKYVADGSADGPHSDSAEPWRPLYEAYVAAGMPSGAPIPGA